MMPRPWIEILRGNSLAVIAIAWLAATATPAAAAPAANIISLQGKGDVRAVQANDWKPAVVQQALAHGDFVRTGDLSQMAILMTDRTQVRLNQNSQVQIKSVADAAQGAQTAIALNSGRAWSQAKPQTTAAGGAASSRLTMETPSATMSIRGTDWEVEVGPDGRTQLTVLSGLVEMANPHGQVMVSRGEGAVAEIGKAPVKIILTRPRERVQWVTAYRPDPARYLDPVERAGQGGLASAARLMAEGRYAEARDRLAALPESWPQRLMQADLKVIEGDLDAAVALSRMAVALSAARAEAVAHLAGLLILADQAEESRKLLAGALARDGGRNATELWLAEGRRARFAGEAVPARNAYAAAARLAPQDDRAWGGLGSVASEREEISVGREYLQRASKLAPKEASHFGELGTLESFADNFARAGEAFGTALALRPDDYVALTGRGVMRLKQGEPDAALEDFLKAGLIEPRYARAHLYSGIAYYQLGRADRARESFARAAELDPRDPLPYLFTGLVHADYFEPGEAVAAAREALARMPFLKSLNQVANNQKGVANVGNALATWGMKDWALSYAQNGDYPFWGGSHLFLADLYEGRYARNSELFQGFLADPTVFGASNRFQTLIHRPGHYQTLTLSASRDKNVSELVPRVTLNGYSNSVAPLAYFLEYDQKQADSSSGAKASDGTPFTYTDTTRSTTAALGWMPTHELRLFAFYNHDASKSNFNNARINNLVFESPTTDLSLGGSYFFAPTLMVQARAGRSRIEGSQAWTQPVGTRNVLGRFDDLEISRDSQLGFRWRQGDSFEVAAGWENARSPETSRYTLSVQGALPPPAYDDGARLTENSRIGWLSGKWFPSATAQVQLDLVATDYEKRIDGDLRSGGVFRLIDRRFSERRMTPRLGFSFEPGAGHRLRYAYQDWLRPSSPGGLAPVATAGIPLEESLVRFGGRVKRNVARLESEWTPRLFTEIGFDSRRSTNLDTYDISLVENFANLARVRQKTLTEVTDFQAGASSSELSNVNLAARAEVDQFSIKTNLIASNSLSLTASYLSTRSKLVLTRDNDPYYLPKSTVRIGATWIAPQRVRYAFDAQWRSTAWTFLDLTAPRRAYWAGAASAYWETADKRWGVAAFAKELFNRNENVFYGVAANLRF
jgi:tetratricopeptide (TPR) repeat protein